MHCSFPEQWRQFLPLSYSSFYKSTHAHNKKGIKCRLRLFSNFIEVLILGFEKAVVIHNLHVINEYSHTQLLPAAQLQA